MLKFDEEAVATFSINLKSLCDSLKIMEKNNNYDGIDFCNNHINNFVEAMTTNGHLGEIRDFFKSEYDEKYIEIIDHAYIFNQSKTLLSMCRDKDNPTSQNQITDVDILKFLINVEQAGEIDKPLESMETLLKQQLEEVCPFEPDFNSEEEQEYYYLIVNHYCDAMPYIYTALNIQTAKEANQPVPSEFNE